MLSFITYQNIPEQLEIVADKKGIEELIEYLIFIKQTKDHLHLIIGSELEEYPEKLEQGVVNAKSVKLEFYKNQEPT